MPREHWELAGPAMTPQYVKEHADELGGMGTHMAISIQKGIHTVPIKHGCSHVSLPVSALTADRITREGGVDIDNAKYWVNVHGAKVFFRGTEESVPLMRGLY